MGARPSAGGLRKAPERRGTVQLVDARDLFTKMRKSLGEKRKEISPDQIAEITRLYGDFTEGDRVKILPNESFGFMRITVEHPLRLRWEITDETLEAVATAKGLAKLTDEARAALIDALREHAGASDRDRSRIATLVDPTLKSHGLAAAQCRAVWAVLAVRDPDADPTADQKGKPEPDPELRDGENVPLPATGTAFEADSTARLASGEYRAAVDSYMTAEVHPFVADAWVDHELRRIQETFLASDAWPALLAQRNLEVGPLVR